MQLLRNIRSKGQIYLIGPHNGHYKIGYCGSSDPEALNKRLQGLRSKVDQNLKVIAAFPAHNPRKMERKLHILFAAQRVCGEWFALTPAQIKSIRLAIRAQDLLDNMNPVALEADRQWQQRGRNPLGYESPHKEYEYFYFQPDLDEYSFEFLMYDRKPERQGMHIMGEIRRVIDQYWFLAEINRVVPTFNPKAVKVIYHHYHLHPEFARCDD